MASRFLLLLALGVGICSGANKKAPPPVNVLKCCRIGDRLANENLTAMEDIQCEPGASTNWLPMIYAPRRHAYLPAGKPSHWTILEQTPVCEPPKKLTLFRSTQPSFTIFINGSLYLHGPGDMLAPMTFCMDSALAAIACLDDVETSSPMQWTLTGRGVRVKKCCGEGAAYSETTRSCVANWSGPELKVDDVEVSKDNGSVLVQLIGGFPRCSAEGGMVIAGTLKEAALESDGSLQLSTAGLRLNKENFCLEYVIEQEKTNVFACSDDVPDALIEETIDRNDVRLMLYPIGLLISTIFLLATLAAAVLLRSTHHALHWRCQMHYIGCLLVGDLMLAIVQLAGNSISGSPCIGIAVTIHFFFLAAFFWLNTMCFNIWWTFRDFRPTSLEKRQEVCRLRVYEVFAWGGPFLIAGAAFLLDILPPDPTQSFLRPRFGVKHCWFFGNLEMLTFFFGPIGVLLVVNLLLFASTARQLTCGLWKREDVKSTTERAALGRVCIKLVVVMGVTWIADLVSWAVGGPSYLWYMTDLINALQGVFIFIVVGFQPQVWAAVKKMWCLKVFRNGAANTTGAPMHSSSQGLPSMGDSVTNNTIANTTNTSMKIPMETVC